MKTIGLTGGIGTGKTTVSEYLKEKGCVIIDADKISKEMTEKGSPALEEIKKGFGGKYISKEGTLERKLLGDLVFNDPEALEKLHAIITKKVEEKIDLILKQLKKQAIDDIVVIDAPLLFECGMESVADENWLITADMQVRIDRVKKRDGLSEKQILDRINNQMSEDEKRGKSRCIIDNSGTVEDLYRHIDKIIERIRDEF